MKHLILIALALALAACASTPPTQPLATRNPAKGNRGPIVIATLAPVGSFEWTAAPTFTRLELVRHRAATRLDDGRIDVATAKVVSSKTKEARDKLDQALAADQAKDGARAESLLAEAKQLAADAESALGR